MSNVTLVSAIKNLELLEAVDKLYNTQHRYINGMLHCWKIDRGISTTMYIYQALFELCMSKAFTFTKP